MAQRARAWGWRLTREAPTNREDGRVRGRRYDLLSGSGRSLVYEPVRAQERRTTTANLARYLTTRGANALRPPRDRTDTAL